MDDDLGLLDQRGDPVGEPRVSVGDVQGDDRVEHRLVDRAEREVPGGHGDEAHEQGAHDAREPGREAEDQGDPDGELTGHDEPVHDVDQARVAGHRHPQVVRRVDDRLGVRARKGSVGAELEEADGAERLAGAREIEDLLESRIQEAGTENDPKCRESLALVHDEVLPLESGAPLLIPEPVVELAVIVARVAADGTVPQVPTCGPHGPARPGLMAFGPADQASSASAARAITMSSRASTRITAGGPAASTRSPPVSVAAIAGTPRTASRRTICDRTDAACSPMPPVKTTPSRRPRDVAAAAIPPAARAANISRASAAFAEPPAAAASSSRTSPLPPPTPASPERCSRASATWSTLSPPWRIAWTMIPGSMDPERVRIIRPSSGVKPIDVHTDRPAATADT